MDPIYGDTAGTLEARAKGQILIGIDGQKNTIYGDSLNIENMRGGNDVLIGGANSIRDTLYGDAYEISDSQGGNDVLLGGSSSQINGLFGDAQQMSRSRGGNDVLAGGNYSSDNFLYGDADFMSYSQGGNDVLTGGANSGFQYNTLIGDASLMDNSQGGHDVLRGGSNSFSNVLCGDATLMANSQGGNDVLTGGANSHVNELYGDALAMSDSRSGNDILIATANLSSSNFVTQNTLYGDAKILMPGNVICGNDRLISGAGNDAMWGDIAYSFDENFGGENLPVDLSRVTTGQDIFVFSANNGTDTIHDFRHGEDKIELKGIGVASFEELMSNLQSGETNTVITFESNTITVIGVTELTAADFLFT